MPRFKRAAEVELTYLHQCLWQLKAVKGKHACYKTPCYCFQNIPLQSSTFDNR